MFPNSAWTSADECAIFVLFLDGKLGFAKYGNEELTPVNDWSPEFDDIIVYKGQFYVVDRLGIVSWIDCSSLKLVQFSPPLCGLGGQKHLVESGGALYVLDRYLDGERRIQLDNNFSVRVHNCPKTVGFQVYRLDEEWGQWIREKSLGDKAFALSDDCSFSVSTRELFGFEGNRIYFLDSAEIYVFNLEDRSFKELVRPGDDFAILGPYQLGLTQRQECGQDESMKSLPVFWFRAGFHEDGILSLNSIYLTNWSIGGICYLCFFSCLFPMTLYSV
ncbi:hypothetical protein CJ030_MR2G004731 [Morella rubra]|uniref:KIB1-4 beta-propeller domain-containing protein n=1 Tax=Morella rubra TaxID=262757 RepID=A0A6A1WER6_9ROSI|nr:hypothetical protein CJ030_MR2G004731 [Morella rubra]